MTQTWAATQAYALEWLGTPYELGGEGTQPGQPVDCSRYVQQVMAWAGITFTRTTETQWADNTFPHEGITANAQPGWIVYFFVPSDGGGAPQHVGIVLGGGQMIEAPHTGADVQIAPIPNSPGESIYGYIVPPYGTAPPPPPPPAKGEDMIAKCDNGGWWVVRANADVYAFGGAPYLGPLPKYTQAWGIGTPSNPVVGIATNGNGGFCLATDNGGPSPAIYNITSDYAYAH